MKKITFCIGKAISLVSDNFLYILYITLPIVLLTALCLSVFPPVAIVPFVVLQGVMFRLWDVNENGIVVKNQKFRSVYVHGLRKAGMACMPQVWWKALKFYFGHASEMVGLSACLLVMYGFVSLMLCAPLLVIHSMKFAEMASAANGDAVNVPVNISIEVTIILFIANYLLALLMTAVLTPFKYMVKKCKEEDTELEMKKLIIK